MHSQALELKSIEEVMEIEARRKKERDERLAASLKAKEEMKQATSFAGMESKLKNHAVLGCFNNKFRSQANPPEDVRKALSELQEKIIKDKDADMILMEHFVEDLDVALQDFDNKEEVLEIMDGYQTTSSLLDLMASIKRPFGAYEKGKAFFEKYADKREKLKADFEEQIKKFSIELTNKLLVKAEKQYKSRQAPFIHFINLSFTHLDREWGETVRSIIHSSQNYDATALFNSAELAEKKFKKVSKIYHALYQLIDDIISIQLKKDSEIALMEQLVDSATKTITSYPKISLAEVQEIMSNTFGALAKNDLFDLEVRKQFQKLEKKYQPKLKSAPALVNRA